MQAQQWPEYFPAVVPMTPLPRMLEMQRSSALTIEQHDQTVVTQEPTPAGGQQSVTTSSRATTGSPAGTEQTRRIVVFVFGLIQVVIAARIILLLLDAREANGLVSGILNIGQVFVGPFEGILRTDSLHSAGSVFDISAVVALAGWTVLELIVIWAIGIFRREPV
jgi:hypothetical protein